VEYFYAAIIPTTITQDVLRFAQTLCEEKTANVANDRIANSKVIKSVLLSASIANPALQCPLGEASLCYVIGAFTSFRETVNFPVSSGGLSASQFVGAFRQSNRKVVHHLDRIVPINNVPGNQSRHPGCR
jgi:hypothetical protein